MEKQQTEAPVAFIPWCTGLAPGKVFPPVSQHSSCKKKKIFLSDLQKFIVQRTPGITDCKSWNLYFRMFPMVEGSALIRSWYLTTRLLSLRARQSSRCCWFSSPILPFYNFYPPFQFWSFIWDHQDKSNWNFSRFKVETWLEFYCKVSAPSTSSLFKMRLWPPAFLTSEICSVDLPPLPLIDHNQL